MNVTHTIAHENQTINHYLHKFPEVLSGISFPPLALFQTFQYPRSFDRREDLRRVRRAFSQYQCSTATRKCESKRNGEKKKNASFYPRNVANGKSERTSIRFDHRFLIRFNFYYRDSLFAPPRGNQTPSFSNSLVRFLFSPSASMIRINWRSIGKTAFYLPLAQFHVFVVIFLRILFPRPFLRKLATPVKVLANAFLCTSIDKRETLLPYNFAKQFYWATSRTSKFYYFSLSARLPYAFFLFHAACRCCHSTFRLYTKA